MGDVGVIQYLLDKLGYEGATALANKLTAARALLLDQIPAIKRPLPSFFETWAFIDEAIWTKTDPAAGTAWNNVVGLGGSNLWVSAVPNAANFARIRSRDYWTVGPAVYGASIMYRKFSFEFELMLTDLANINEATTYYGFSNPGDTRASNNIICFAIAANVLQTLTKNGAAEETNTGFLEDLTIPNKLKIEAYAGHVKFYLNEAQIADHTNIVATLSAGKVINFYHAADAGVGSGIRIGQNRAWYDDEV